MDEQITIPADERAASDQVVIRDYDAQRLILRSLHRIEDLLVLLVRQTQAPAPDPMPERKTRKPRKRKQTPKEG